jgi:putative transposase
MSYPTDLTDKQWQVILPFFPSGNKSKHSKRVLVNAVLYVNKTGCQWRMLPNDFPSWKTVYTFYNRAKKAGVWKEILRYLVQEQRTTAGKNPSPTYGIIDSQSVKTNYEAQEVGFDGGKK